MSIEDMNPAETIPCKFIVEIVWDDGDETFHGPFENENDATEWVEQYVGDDPAADDWSVIPLNAPVVL